MCEFPFRVPPLFDGQEILRITSEQFRELPRLSDKKANLTAIINRLGELSAIAQDLPAIITTVGKFSASNQTLFLIHDGHAVTGLLKIGVKKLFLYDGAQVIHEMSPMCILDFYVSEKFQRRGIGRRLFDAALIYTNISPHRFAIDRPSPKLIGFYAKHFGLKSYMPQNNSYVVFEDFFNPTSPVKPKPAPFITEHVRTETPSVEHQQPVVQEDPVEERGPVACDAGQGGGHQERVPTTEPEQEPAPVGRAGEDLMAMQRRLNATTYDYMRRNTTLGRHY
ncbi:Alpha-tubulin N-acetyltransferase [Carpediemonas membranifera]|uniref:Alpha-tubulin N-acetyltransferase n=1 Tax=Carpediemonas membranifera TaxID=201153 RepID=A0A8J6B413_9EUKA|nr:Alpha-tubulin N-acetyltransferase [Carpediemonas membranifera]|eukprot:KAG9395253.1 Alpha-tubulin N-acetyltransferase [Carpediemonas membranifera]